MQPRADGAVLVVGAGVGDAEAAAFGDAVGAATGQNLDDKSYHPSFGQLLQNSVSQNPLEWRESHNHPFHQTCRMRRLRRTNSNCLHGLHSRNQTMCRTVPGTHSPNTDTRCSNQPQSASGSCTRGWPLLPQHRHPWRKTGQLSSLLYWQTPKARGEELARLAVRSEGAR